MTAAPRHLAHLVGGPLDGETVRIYCLDGTPWLYLPAVAGRYVEDRVTGDWFWEQDARPVP